MNDRYPQFLVAPSNDRQSLRDAIRKVGNASLGFSQSWNDQDLVNALATSEEAFSLLDHIQNELLRRRDARSSSEGWNTSSFFKALQAEVGNFVSPLDTDVKDAFKALEPGQGAMPVGAPSSKLKLV